MKAIGTKDIVKGNKKGLKPRQRKLSTHANQWSNSPMQQLFIEKWLDPKSPTFGNAYRSALEAGFKRGYAVQIASPSINLKWLQESTKRLLLSDEHLKVLLSEIAMEAKNSRSPDDTRVKSMELLLRVSGALDNRNTTNITLVQPILGGESVKPTKVPSEVIDQ